MSTGDVDLAIIFAGNNFISFTLLKIIIIKLLHDLGTDDLDSFNKQEFV